MKIYAFLTEMIHEKMCEIFQVPSEDETRLWQRYMTNSHELLTNENQTVSDAGIYGGQVHLHVLSVNILLPVHVYN